MRAFIAGVLLLCGLGSHPVLAQSISPRDLPGETVQLDGDSVVFVFPARVEPAREVRAAQLRERFEAVRERLAAANVNVVESTAFKYAWGHDETRGAFFLDPRRTFLGTLFVRTGQRQRSQVDEAAAETADELLARASSYFGRDLVSPGSR